MMLRILSLLAIAVTAAAQSNTLITLLPVTDSTTGAITDTGTLRFRDTGSFAVDLQAPATLAASYKLRFPTALASGCLNSTASGSTGTLTFTSCLTSPMTNSTSWAWLDGAGVARDILFVNSINDFRLGFQGTPAVGGDTYFYARGVHQMTLNNGVLAPAAAGGLQFGTALLPFGSADFRGNVTVRSLLGTGGTLFLESGGGGNYAGIRAHPSSANYTSIWPSAQGSGALTNDGSGNLTWAAAGVTSVTGSSPIVSSGGTTPAISCATCVTTNTNQTISGTKTFSSTQVFNNAVGVNWLDGAGTQRTLLFVNSTNDFRIGFQGTPVSGGDIVFYARGNPQMTLNNGVLAPNAAGGVQLGTALLPFDSLTNRGSIAIMRSVSAQSGRLGMETGSGSGNYFTMAAHASSDHYTIVWPQSQGAAASASVNDGSGNLSWTPVLSLAGTHTFSGSMTVTGNLYNRTYSGGDANCTGVANGWFGIRTDVNSGKGQIQICVGGATSKWDPI